MPDEHVRVPALIIVQGTFGSARSLRSFMHERARESIGSSA